MEFKFFLTVRSLIFPLPNVPLLEHHHLHMFSAYLRKHYIILNTGTLFQFNKIYESLKVIYVLMYYNSLQLVEK